MDGDGLPLENVPSQLSLEAANEGDGGDQALTTAVTGQVQEAGSRVLANPFWSDRATEEFHLQQARPNTLPLLGSLPEDARTVHDAGQTDAYGGPEAQGHDVRHDSNQEAPSRERSTSPGVKLILTEMKQLLQDIVATQQEHGSRLEKLESPELQSACSAQASSHGNPNYVATQPIVQETLNQNSNLGSRSQGAQGQFVFLEGVPLPVSAGARAAPDTNAGGCQHFYIGGPLKQKSQKPCGSSQTPPLQGDGLSSVACAPRPGAALNMSTLQGLGWDIGERLAHIKRGGIHRWRQVAWHQERQEPKPHAEECSTCNCNQVLQEQQEPGAGRR